MRNICIFLAAAWALAGCCTSSRNVGTRVDALDDCAWEASEWISAANAPVVEGPVLSKKNGRSADGAAWFVGEVENGRKVRSARWMATGLGVFELFVNGKPVGEEVLKPGFTHYAKTKRSFTYDVTGAIDKRAGAVNVLSAQVTPGWWGDKIVTPYRHNGMVGRKCAFRSVLEVVYDDGSTALFGTGPENWKAGIAGPVKHAGIFDGEEYDARCLPGYDTPGLLSEPEKNEEFNGEILPSKGGEIYLRHDLAMSPVEAYTWSGVEGKTDDAFGKVVKHKEFRPGETMRLTPGDTLVVDFGQNAAAVPRFEFKAAEGTTLTCLPGEILNDGNGARSRGMDGPEGSLHRTNLRVPDQFMRLVYTFGPSRGFVTYYPHCTFFGYRFISVTVDGDVEIRKIESVPVTSIAENLETGVIKTGDDMVNKLISNTVWGQRSNYLSVPTDCPQRDERLGWTADTQVFTETGAFFANTCAFFHKWMRDMRDSQSETGAFPGVAPTAQYGGNMMRLGWADAGIIVPWTVWKQFGDASIIEENWDAMTRFMEHVAQTGYDHASLSDENGNYQWADWLSYEPLESRGESAFTKDASGQRIPLPDAVQYWNYLSKCYMLTDSEMMADMANAVGRSREAESYAAQAQQTREVLKETFLIGDRFVTDTLNTMQTPALFALRTGLVEGMDKDSMIARLKENFAAHGGCLQTGFLGTSILMETLTENGMADIAYDLLFQRKNPSWLYSVDNGATTIWERWNSYTKESGMGPSGMNSFNHYAYGCVCAWIWKTVAGIASDTGNPGFRHIIMKPVPDRRLGHVEASYLSASGLIKSSWKYQGNNWLWTFTVPDGAEASVTLPGETESKTYGPGTWKISKEL